MAEQTIPSLPATTLTNSPGKTAASRMSHVPEIAALSAVAFAAAGHLLIKYGLNSLQTATIPHGFLTRILNCLLQPAVAGGLAVYAIGTVLWVCAVSKREISYIFPLSALNYVVVGVFGRLLFGEAIPNSRWLGISVVVLGVVLMQWRGREDL